MYKVIVSSLLVLIISGCSSSQPPDYAKKYTCNISTQLALSDRFAWLNGQRMVFESQKSNIWRYRYHSNILYVVKQGQDISLLRDNQEIPCVETTLLATGH